MCQNSIPHVQHSTLKKLKPLRKSIDFNHLMKTFKRLLSEYSIITVPRPLTVKMAISVSLKITKPHHGNKLNQSVSKNTKQESFIYIFLRLVQAQNKYKQMCSWRSLFRNGYQENQSIAQGFLARAGSFIILYRYRTFYIYLGHQRYLKLTANISRQGPIYYEQIILSIKLKLWLSRLINLQERKLAKMSLFFVKNFLD